MTMFGSLLLPALTTISALPVTFTLRMTTTRITSSYVCHPFRQCKPGWKRTNTSLNAMGSGYPPFASAGRLPTVWWIHLVYNKLMRGMDLRTRVTIERISPKTDMPDPYPILDACTIPMMLRIKPMTPRMWPIGMPRSGIQQRTKPIKLTTSAATAKPFVDCGGPFRYICAHTPIS